MDMAFLEWNESYSVGVSAIDDQHKTIVRMVNELQDAMRRGKGRVLLDELFGNLVEYTATHFRDEEAYMQRIGYPQAEFDAHCRKHREMTDKVLDLKRRFESDEVMISIRLMDLLKTWLSDHILGMDKQFSPASMAARI